MQDVDDTSEAKISGYFKSKVLTDEESNKIEGKITLSELQYALFTKIKDSSAPGIDDFMVNWLRKFCESLKLVTLDTIN